MKDRYSKTIFLILLPFLVWMGERLLGYIFQIVLGSDFLILRFGVTSLAIIFFILLVKNNYSLIVPTRFRKITLSFLVLLPISALLLLAALRFKGYPILNWNGGLMIWILIVFREEFILRGYIQTRAYDLLPGKFLGLSKAIWLSSILFSLLHLVNFYAPNFSTKTIIMQLFAALFIGGPILGLVREKTGSTLTSFLVHINSDLLFYTGYLLVMSKLFINPWI